MEGPDAVQFDDRVREDRLSKRLWALRTQRRQWQPTVRRVGLVHEEERHLHVKSSRQLTKTCHRQNIPFAKDKCVASQVHLGQYWPCQRTILAVKVAVCHHNKQHVTHSNNLLECANAARLIKVVNI